MKKLLHICIVTFVIYITILSKPGTSLFSFHPFCMALAYGVLMTEGILTFTSGSLWAPETSRSTLIYNHWLLNTVAGIVATAGFVAIYWNKSRKGMNHFVSYHGIVGLICVCYSIVQLIAGFCLKYQSCLPQWTSYKIMKTLHSVSGVIAFCLGISTLILSFSSNWYVENSYPYVDVASVFLYGTIFFFISIVVVKKCLGLFP